MLIVLRITAVSVGSVEYLLRGSGCAEHEHTPQRDQETGVERDAAGYFLSAAEHGEAPGRWFGRGVEMLGIDRIQSGAIATEDDVRAVFGKLEHPETGESLGRAPRNFKDYQARLAAAQAKEPEATPERRHEIELQVRLDSRKAVSYFDFTFSPVKSASVYYTALLSAGRIEDAAEVLQAHRNAVGIAMSYAEKHGAYTRTGYHGRTKDGRSVGRYEAADGLVITLWDHSTNREKEPQLHTHGAVLNRVWTSSDGVIRALDGKGFRLIKEALATAYERAFEDTMTVQLPVRFAWRPDGKAREILGVDPQLCAAASTRRAQVEERKAELVEAYVDRHGYEPSAAALKAISQAATLETRKAKGQSEAGPAALREWGQAHAEAMAATLDAVEAAAAMVEREGHPDLRALPDQRDREAILRAAVAQVQTQYPTWTLGNLVAAIDKQVLILPCPPQERPAYIEAMAREVVEPGNRYGTLLLTAPDLVQVPVPLQRQQDGRSIFRPHMDERYTTEEHLSTERRVVLGARQQTALAIQGAELELLRVELATRGLGEDQAAAVLGVVSSGRAGDNLVGPAGAGKSFTLGVLAQVWADRFGGRVIGLATSQRAAQVLAEDGIKAINTTVFLQRFTPDENGQAWDCVCRGDLIVVDETSMSSTAELARISALVEAGGGKLLYTGDHHQLSAVTAGGLFELLVTDNGAYELKRIHRFHHDWEKHASLRLRVGDTSVLCEYENRGRLLGGTVEDMQAAAIRGYLADTLSGLDSLLIVRSNAEAAQLSEAIRQELVQLGYVEAKALGELRDGNVFSVGDLIQARRNDYSIQVDGPGMVTNRQTYTVCGRDSRGWILVEDANGVLAHLPESYLREHVTLAYASTIHAVQGRTVDTSHSLLDVHSTCNDSYTALTRGTLRNTAYLTTHRRPDSHDAERLEITPTECLAAILDNVGADRAAELEHRVGRDEARSLAWLGTQWDEVSKEYATYRYTDTLRGLLTTEQMDALVAEPGYDRLMRAVRLAELTGHNAETVIARAVSARELYTADSVSNVLRGRVRKSLTARTPEQQIDPRDWTTLAAPLDGTVGQFIHEMAVLASDRQAVLGERAAQELPEWAVSHLGLPPEESGHREEWVCRAGIAAAYRELRNVPADQVSVGAAPSREQEFHRALWQQAHVALGQPADMLDYYMASEAELREMRAWWQREQTWAPAYVADEMQAAYTLAESYCHDAALFGAQLATMAEKSPEHTQTLAEVQRVERMAADYTERARQLEEIHATRQHWLEATETARLRDQLAAEELERRGVPLSPQPQPTPEQLTLFDIEPQPAAQARTAEPEPQIEPAPEPVEHVRWWQHRADHLTARTTTAGLDHETTLEPKPAHLAEPVVENTGTAAAWSATAEQPPLAISPDQLALFDIEPTVEDRVQAQPLRLAEQTQHRGEDAELRVTLAEARRQARAAEQLRHQREAADATRAEQCARVAAPQMVEADRARRDHAQRDAQRAAEQQRERQVDEPQIELVQTPTQPEPTLDEWW